MALTIQVVVSSSLTVFSGYHLLHNHCTTRYAGMFSKMNTIFSSGYNSCRSYPSCINWGIRQSCALPDESVGSNWLWVACCSLGFSAASKRPSKTLRPVEPVDDRVPREQSAGFPGDEDSWQLRVAATHGGATSLDLACGAHWRFRRGLAEAWPGLVKKALVLVAPRPIYFPIHEPCKNYTCSSPDQNAILSDFWTAYLSHEASITQKISTKARKVPSWHKTCHGQNKLVAGLINRVYHLYKLV